MDRNFYQSAQSLRPAAEKALTAIVFWAAGYALGTPDSGI